MANSPMLASQTSDNSPETTNLPSRDVFRLLVDSVTDYAIFVLDPAGIICSWNSGAERLQGYKAHEIIGKHFSIFYPEPDAAVDKPHFELRVAAEKGRFEAEGWRLRSDGTRFRANVVITRILSGDGRLLGFGTIIRDLTERRRTEQKYRLLIEQVMDYAIFSMDPHGYIQSWNLGAERLKGYSADEIIGQHFSRFYGQEDRERGLPQHVLDTAAATGHFEGEGWRYRKDGSKFWASIVVTALRDEEANLYGFSKLTRDMTERKMLLDQLRQHSEELELRVREREQSNAELEAFSYSVSHDLRAPLRAIAGFAGALNEDYGPKLDDTARDFLQEIISASARMNSQVQDLLDYGRIGRVNMPLQPVNVAATVRAALKQTGEERNPAVTIEVPQDTYVSAYPQVLAQVLSNLISNALKFCRENSAPEVRVWIENRGAMIRISIKDNGIGIAPQHLERIWNVFERLHDRSTYPGSGIGLAIVKRAVNRMQGNYGVDSELGMGSTFWLELPGACKPVEETN